MRKHFLLLFLMALLPLAGWAQDEPVDPNPGAEPAANTAFNLSSVTTVRAVYPQGITQLIYNAQNRSNIAWTFEYQKEGSTEWYAIDKAECDIIFYGAAGNTDDPGDAVTVKNAGQYYVAIAAKGGSEVYSGAVPAGKRPGFVIQQFPMTIQANGTEKVYGDTDPTTLTWDVVNETSLPEPKENIAITFAYQRDNVGADEGEQVNLVGYDLTCTATATNYDIEVTGSPKLVITPATLKVFYDKDNNVSKDIVVKYGEIAANQPLAGTSTDKVAFEGWKRNDAPAANAEWAFGDLALTPSYVTANVGPDGDDADDLLQGKVAHIAYISLGAVTKVDDKYVLGNYYVDYQSPALYVQQATIENTTGAFTFAKDPHAAFTYDGASHVATYTIKYGTVGGTPQAPTFTAIETLTAGTDYTIDWKYGDAADTHENKWAGTYTAIIKAVANGNYYTAAEGVELSADALKYAIGKRDLAVYSEDDSKIYNAQAPVLNENKIYWSGLIQDDQTLATTTNKAAKDFFELKYVEDAYNTNAPVDKGIYKVIPVAKENVSESALKTSLTTNYKPQFSQSNFAINAKPINITALQQSIKFGDQVAIETRAMLDDPNTEANEATVDLGEIVAEQKGTMLGYLELSLKEGTYTTADTYEDAIEVNVKDDTGLNEEAITAKTKFLANYTLNPVAGDFVIANASFKMFAKTNSVIYGEEYALTADYGFDYGTLDFAGTIAADANITYTLEKNGVELDELPTDAGTYQINVRLAAEDIPAGYDAPSYIQGTFTILPRPITVTPVAQSLQKGAREDALETYNIEDSKVIFSYTGDAEKTAIIDDDEIDYTLIFNVQSADEDGLIPAAQVQNTGTQEAPVWKLIDNATEATYAAGITVKAGVNANYVITPATGALTVIGANTLVLDQSDVDLNAKINAAKNTDQNIIFGTRTLTAGNWYTMVLPFEIRTADLVAALRAPNTGAGTHPVYAIVNTFSAEASSKKKISFKLEMSKIEANEPFMIKTAEDVDMADAVFGTQSIKYTTTPASEADADGDQFIGTYTATPIIMKDGINYGWYDSDGQKKWRQPETNAHTMQPMEAYLKYAAGTFHAPVITLEDLNENGTTSIVTFNADSKSFVAVDGWYTLNGVKLQGAPTEKGIYINNGKKIVIK